MASIKKKIGLSVGRLGDGAEEFVPALLIGSTTAHFTRVDASGARTQYTRPEEQYIVPSHGRGSGQSSGAECFIGPASMVSMVHFMRKSFRGYKSKAAAARAASAFAKTEAAQKCLVSAAQAVPDLSGMRRRRRRSRR